MTFDPSRPDEDDVIPSVCPECGSEHIFEDENSPEEWPLFVCTRCGCVCDDESEVMMHGSAYSPVTDAPQEVLAEEEDLTDVPPVINQERQAWPLLPPPTVDRGSDYDLVRQKKEGG